MQAGDVRQPLVDGLGRDESQMVAFCHLVDGLDGDVGLDRPAEVATVEGVVGATVGWVQESDGSVHCQLDDRNGSSLDQFDVREARLALEQLFETLQRPTQLHPFRQIVKHTQHAIIDRNVDIAIFNRNPTGTTTKQFDRYLVVAQQELDPFIGDDAPLVELVRLL